VGNEENAEFFCKTSKEKTNLKTSTGIWRHG